MNQNQHQSPHPFTWRLVPLFLALLFAAGCGDLRQRAVALWPFGPAPTPTPSARSIALLGWVGTEAENTQLQQAIVTFEHSNPHFPVAGRLLPDYALALEEEIDSDTPPDLFLAHSHQLADLVDDGLILPIPSAYPVTNAIAPNLTAALQVNGQNYCFPRDVAVLSLFYNRAVFDRAEASYPDSSWGWTEFRAALDATGDINNGYYGLILDYDLSRFLTFLLQSSNDGDIWLGDDALAAIEYYMDFYNDEVAAVSAHLDSTWNGEAFGRGRAAMTIEGNWLVPYLANSFPSVDYGIVELPSGPTGRGTVAFVSCWVIYAQSENVDGALALASFLTSPTQLSSWAHASGNLPPTIELATAWGADHPTYAPFVASLSYATPWTGPAGFLSRAETVNLSMDRWYKDTMTTPELVGALSTMSENPPLPTPTATPSETQP